MSEKVAPNTGKVADGVWKATTVLFWGWLIAGIFSPLDSDASWYAVFLGLGFANMFALIVKSVKSGAWENKTSHSASS